MKRLNWLRNLGLFTATTAAIIPTVLTATSCGMNGYYVDEFTYADVIENVSAKNVKHYSESFDSLLLGSKSHHNGNYVLFVGSVTNDATVNFFGVPGYNHRQRSQWYDDENFWQSPFYRGLLKASLDDKVEAEGMKDCGFYNFIDFFDGKFYDKTGHEIYIVTTTSGITTQNVKPFDKWNDSIINQTKLYNKDVKGYDWDETSVSKNDYIRQDDYAVAFRKMCQRGLALYPKNDKRKDSFLTDDNCNTAKMVVFKDGVLVSISEMPNGTPSAMIESFSKVVIENYKVQKDEEKK